MTAHLGSPRGLCLQGVRRSTGGHWEALKAWQKHLPGPWRHSEHTDKLYGHKCFISAKKWCFILLLKPKQSLFNVEIGWPRKNISHSADPTLWDLYIDFLHYSKIYYWWYKSHFIHCIHPVTSPHPNISYPAFSIHFTFALLQGFLEHRLVSLATEFLLSTDTDTWWPSGYQRFCQASQIVSPFYIYGLNIKLEC